MTDRKAMRQALEALELLSQQPIEMALDYADNAIEVLRARLAQPEQRPVPPPWWPAVENILHEYGLQAIDFVDDFKKALAQPEQEPVGRLESDPDEGHVFVPRIDGDWSMLGEDLYTSPPQRTWVDVPDEEIKILWIQYRAAMPRYLCFANALLARSKEKNT